MRTGRLAPLLLVIGIVVAACGSSNDSDGVASLENLETTTTVTEAELEIDEESALGFSQCMRDQGFDFPDPTVDGEGNLSMGEEIDLQSFGQTPEEIQNNLRNAFDACSEHLSGINFGATLENLIEMEDRFLELAACVRENGYDMDDPDFSSPDGFIEFGDLDLEDPAFLAAVEACRHIFTDFQPGG